MIKLIALYSFTCGCTVNPAKDHNPNPMMGTQHAASVATNRLIRQAIADSLRDRCLIRVSVAR